MKIDKVIIMGCLLSVTYGHCGAYVSRFMNMFTLSQQTTLPQNSLSVAFIDQTLEASKKQKVAIAATMQTLRHELDSYAGQIKQSKNQAEKEVGRENIFLQKKLSLLNQVYQTLTDREQALNQIVHVVDEKEKVLGDYKADIGFEHLKTTFKSIKNFKEFQELAERISHGKTHIIEYEKNKKQITDDSIQWQKTLQATQQEYREKKKQQELFSGTFKGIKDQEGLTMYQRGQLFDIQEHLAAVKQDFAQTSIELSQVQSELLEVQLGVEREKLVFLQEHYEPIKRQMQVDAAYVQQVHEQLEQARQGSVEKTDRLHDKIKILLDEKEELQHVFDQKVGLFGLSTQDIVLIKDLTKQPESIKQWDSVSQLIQLIMKQEFIDTEREFLGAQIDVEKSQFRHEKIGVDMVRSWFTMTSRQFGIDIDAVIDQEVKSYAVPKAELLADDSTLNDKRDRALNQLRVYNTMLDRLKELDKKLRSSKTTLFKEDTVSYMRVIEALFNAQEYLRDRIDKTAKCIELYSTCLSVVQESLKRVDYIIEELQSKSFWRRADYAIGWHEVKEFIPQVSMLIQFIIQAVYKSIGQINIGKTITQGIVGMALMDMLTILFNILVFLFIFFLMRWILKIISVFCSTIAESRHGLFAMALSWLIVISNFVLEYLIIIYSWLLLLFLLKVDFIHNPLISIIIYGASIGVFLYLARQFILYISYYNQNDGYELIDKDNVDRFFSMGRFLLYTSVVVLFIRQIFLIGDIDNSYVPTLLLAFESFVIQIFLISLLQKELFHYLVRSDTPIAEWLEQKIDKYYALIVSSTIVLILMSNPYIGYGRQILYIVSRLTLTALMIPLFLWLYNTFRKICSDLFFYYAEDESLKERFVAARTWYGILVTIFFVMLIGGAVLLSGYLWGHTITLGDLYDWFSYEIYSPGNDDFGKRISVTFISLCKLVLFVLGGIALNYIINKFILKRFFDPLLVGLGIQSTVLTLTRYSIIIFSVLLGMNKAGLDGLTTKIMLALAAIAYVVQEPFKDFFSYFIILVQRPIKIGDLVRISDENLATENEIMGVVRQITPRSVVIRKKNSVTILVPNSVILTKAIYNWNYTRNFFAFDDIILTVPYSYDPVRIKAVIMQVLEQNINVLKNPAPVVFLRDFVENGYQFLVRGYLTADKVAEQWEIMSNVRIELVRHLHLAGMEIAMPTRRVIKMIEKEKEKSGTGKDGAKSVE